MPETKNFWYCAVIVNRPDGPRTHLIRAASKPNPAQFHEAFPDLAPSPDDVAAVRLLDDREAAVHPDLAGADARPVFDAVHNGTFGLYSVMAYMPSGAHELPYPGLVAAESARQAVAKADAYLKTVARDLSDVLDRHVAFSVGPEHAHRASDSYSNPLNGAEMSFKFLAS